MPVCMVVAVEGGWGQGKCFIIGVYVSLIQGYVYVCS